MTTSQSPLRVLKAQADKVAASLKAFERGEPVDPGFAAKIEAARGRPSIKFGIVMDDKIITVDMPWTLIASTGEAGLSEYILKQMRGSRDVVH